MIIQEHYVTVDNNDIDLKARYIDQVWKILQQSYKTIGGLMGFNSPEDLLKNNNMWKLVRRNNDRIVAAAIYKTTQGGRKLVAGGSDGTTQGKHDFYEICREDVKMPERGTWGEVSGALEGILLFRNEGVPIPNTIVKNVVAAMRQPDIICNPDGFHYTRIIYNKPYEKIMMGNVPVKFRQTDDWSTESKNYRLDFDKYNQEHPEELRLRKDKYKNK